MLNLQTLEEPCLVHEPQELPHVRGRQLVQAGPLLARATRKVRNAALNAQAELARDRPIPRLARAHVASPTAAQASATATASLLSGP